MKDFSEFDFRGNNIQTMAYPGKLSVSPVVSAIHGTPPRISLQLSISGLTPLGRSATLFIAAGDNALEIGEAKALLANLQKSIELIEQF